MKHIKSKSSEILHGGKTLDKEIKDINDKIQNISPDGSIIATKEKLGNVIIGDNINVDKKGVINVPRATKGKIGLVAANSQPDTVVHQYIDVCIDKNSNLYVPISDGYNYGVVKPDNNDFIFTSNGMSLRREKGNITTLSGGIIKYNLYDNKGTITQQYISNSSINSWDLNYMDDHKHKFFICLLLKVLLKGATITYICQIKAADSNTFVECIIADLKLEFRYDSDVYSSIDALINAININTIYDIILYGHIRIYFDYKYNNSNKTANLFAP